MINKEEAITLIVVLLIALLIIIPPMFNNTSCNTNEKFDSRQRMQGSQTSQGAQGTYNVTGNVADTVMDATGTDPAFEGTKMIHPKGTTKDYESLIFDDTTGAIMTGSQFMENTGIVAPLWVPPAWDPDAYGPSSKGELDPADYENDPRMLYNKCSLSCCSAQYPTPFQGTVNPFVCDKDGDNKYLASDYICQNNTGGVGCLCMTEKQAKGMQRGFVDYYADKELGY